MATTKPPYDVLVLVEDAGLRSSLSERLEGLGHSVENRLSVLSGLDRVRERMPDLILLDLEVDGGGGMPFLQILRRSQVTRSVPVLVVGGAASPEALREAHELGASGPVTMEAGKELEGWIFVAMSRHLRKSAAIA